MLGQLTREQIEQVLRTEMIGRIGCHADGRTYVVPVTYAYDGASVYCHSADGMKIQMMRKNPEVCFEVDHMDSMADWQSVIAWGRFEELEGADAEAAMKRLIERFAPRVTSETATPSHGHRADTGGRKVVMYRITLTEKTGRFERR